MSDVPGAATFTVPVTGGDLSGADWHADAGGMPLVGIHGITADHLSWAVVAEALPRVRLIAPDLRGRGRSGGLPGPYGMVQHADDLARLLDELGVERAVVAGHSMGGFVAVRLAERHPGRVERLVLIDGGLPVHRARELDLVGSPPELRSSVSEEAVLVDAQELDGSAGYEEALAGLTLPIAFVRVPRGLRDADPLYLPQEVSAWRRRLPWFEVFEADDVNQHTIVMTEAGVRQLMPHLPGAYPPHPRFHTHPRANR